MIPMSDKWKTVKIPAVLADQVDALLDAGGYASRSAWVSELIRHRLENLPTKRKKAKLTQAEEDRLYSWARTTHLKGAEEADITTMLQENAHLQDWAGILRKLPDAVAFVLSLKQN
jgi:Arc/MetJ-type ribon-helix-helix transcriptional regulator